MKLTKISKPLFSDVVGAMKYLQLSALDRENKISESEKTELSRMDSDGWSSDKTKFIFREFVDSSCQINYGTAFSVVTVNGNILDKNDSDNPVIICHQVNTLGIMGAGLAKQIHTLFPITVFEKYSDYCESGASLGDILLTDTPSHNYTIANLFAQNRISRNECVTDYDAMRICLTKLRRSIISIDNCVVRIPYKMGCGLGGGNWDIIEQIIKDTLVDYGVVVEIWKFEDKSHE